LFEKERKQAQICLVAECAGLQNEIVISRNGKIGARLACSGRARHIGMDTQEKASAILEIAHQVIALESLNASLPGVSVNIGKIEGGLGPATIPDHAVCSVDVRWQDESHREILLKKINLELTNNRQPHCHSRFEILNERPSMPFTGMNQELIDLFQQTAEMLGHTIPTQHRRGTSDANFFGSAGIPTIDGLGPISDCDHTPDEYISVSSLRDRTILLACFLYQYGRQAGMIH